MKVKFQLHVEIFTLNILTFVSRLTKNIGKSSRPFFKKNKSYDVKKFN